MTEEWRSVEEFAGKYLVSDLGRVKNASTGVLINAKISRPKRGYLFVGLYSRQGKRITRFIHRLMLQTFVGPAPKGTQAAHLDGNSLHNSLSNLRWATPAENAEDRDGHGTTVRGDKHFRARLSDELVRYIRSSPASCRVLGKELGIAAGQIGSVRQGKSWAHVTPSGRDGP